MPTYTQGHSEEIYPEDAEVEFLVKDAQEQESKSGNETILLELSVTKNGKPTDLIIYDNLVFTPKSFWKIDDFRQATGEILIPGETVVFGADDCVHRKGRAILTVDDWKGRKRNKIKEYVVPSSNGSLLV